MALYTKYRSKRFDQVLTQDHVVSALQSFLAKANDIPQGYVFFGTRGSGKTSLARIYARALNCLDKDFVSANLEPCNECESCRLALSNSNPDIIEMDAASNRGIDDIRSIKESAVYNPTVGSKRIYIIDEAHMMTKEAFNALLKILEEPPAHVFFVLCTTEIYKLPPTILSRTQVFELKNASIEDLKTKVALILNKETGGMKVTVSDIVIAELARLGNGSFRDTETILERLIQWMSSDVNLDSLGESREVTLEVLFTVLGLTALDKVQKLFDSIYSKDLSQFTLLFDAVVTQDSVSTLVEQLVHLTYKKIRQCLEQGNIKGGSSSNFLNSELKELGILLQLFIDLSKKNNSSNFLRVNFFTKIITYILDDTADVKRNVGEEVKLAPEKIEVVRKEGVAKETVPLIKPSYFDNSSQGIIAKNKIRIQKEEKKAAKKVDVEQQRDEDELERIKKILEETGF